MNFQFTVKHPQNSPISRLRMHHYDNEMVVSRFNRLMKDVISGQWQRTSFESWEIELLLDIEACAGEIRSRRDLLTRYQKAVQRQLAQRREMPMKLSEYVSHLRTRQAARQTRVTESEFASALS
jgi:hypothetical protein